MPNLRIDLVQESANQVYFSGNTVSGNVLLDIDKPKSYKQVCVQFIGRSQVQWTESHTEGSGEYQRTVTRIYSSTESYADLVVNLWDSRQSPDGKLAPGQYRWPFVINIPSSAPSSFEGCVGRIRYTLTGRIRTGSLKFDHTVQVKIPVQQPLSITNPHLLQPQSQEVQKTVCCLCCASQPIILSVSVPKTGFYIGESFTLNVSLENGSRRRLTLIASIRQNVRYYAQGHCRGSRKTLNSIGSDAIQPRATHNWEPTIEIPLTEVIDEYSCSNIKVDYLLLVTARIRSARNLSTSFLLKLGNCRKQEGQNPSMPPTQPTPQGPSFNTQLPPPGVLPPSHPKPLKYPPPGIPPASTSTQPPPNYNTATGAIGWSTNISAPPASGPALPPQVAPETLADIPASHFTKK